jgi:putative hydrolase of the HAD superfamily
VITRAVIFDFYGTLAEANARGPSWSELFRELGHELSIDATRRLWNDGVDGIEHDEHSQSRDHYVAWQQARVREIIEASGVPEGDDDLLFSHITERLGSPDLHAYEEVVPVLHELRDRGFALAICSNWDWDLLEAIDSAGLGGTVDVVESSAWVGARKPNPRIYAKTLADLAVDPAHAVFVGDTWTCDTEGPRRAGMRPVYVRRPHFGPDATRPEHVDDSGVTYTEDLNVLPELLVPIS